MTKSIFKQLKAFFFPSLVLGILLVLNFVIAITLRKLDSFDFRSWAKDFSPASLAPQLPLADIAKLQTQYSTQEIIKNIETKERIVALSFDDGPSSNTLDILNILDNYQIKASFFVIGQWIDQYPNILKEIHKRGHEIANHSNTHPSFLNSSASKIAQEILITENKIFRLTKQRPALFRLPFGHESKNFWEMNKFLNYLVIGWNSDPQDWKKQSDANLLKTIDQEVKPGGIILLHDGPPYLDRQQTLDLLPKLIEKLQAEGYSFVTVGELLLGG